MRAFSAVLAAFLLLSLAASASTIANSAANSPRIETFRDQYNGFSGQVPGFVNSFIGTETIKATLSLKDGSSIVFGAKTENGRITEVSEEPYKDSTIGLTFSEELAESIAASDNPAADLQREWGKGIKYEGLNLFSGLKVFIMDIGVWFWKVFSPVQVPASALPQPDYYVIRSTIPCPKSSCSGQITADMDRTFTSSLSFTFPSPAGFSGPAAGASASILYGANATISEGTVQIHKLTGNPRHVQAILAYRESLALKADAGSFAREIREKFSTLAEGHYLCIASDEVAHISSMDASPEVLDPSGAPETPEEMAERAGHRLESINNTVKGPGGLSRLAAEIASAGPCSATIDAWFAAHPEYTENLSRLANSVGGPADLAVTFFPAGFEKSFRQDMREIDSDLGYMRFLLGYIWRPADDGGMLDEGGSLLGGMGNYSRPSPPEAVGSYAEP